MSLDNSNSDAKDYMLGRPITLWLADLTYDQQIVATDVIPLAIGGLASYLKSKITPNPDITLLKYPGQFKRILEEGDKPDIVGFSNYIWNKNLALEFAKVLHEVYPETIIIFGGPNYPVDASEQEGFLNRYPVIDYYVYGEGEIAFYNLVSALRDVLLDKCKISSPIEGVHYLNSTGEFVDGGHCKRIRDINEIPSPYLDGSLDEFFDGTLTPIIQTKRGCPFKCTFCVEGQSYYNITTKGDMDKTKSELEYISEMMIPSIKSGKKDDLHIADSNYGMFKEDLESARKIAETQKKYKYPKYISVATGKNQKSRVLEVANILNGALRLSGAVQSLDTKVLEAVKRTNITTDEIEEFAEQSIAAGANSYGQMILCLPNDTVEGHFQSIGALIDTGFSFISLNQLMMLPGSDIAKKDCRDKYGMKTKWRVLPRCFAHYKVCNRDVRVAEVEEICVELSGLSFSQYLDCRRMHLMVFVFYNDGIFKGILRLLDSLGISAWTWLESIYNEELEGRLGEIVDEFVEATRDELWDTEEDLLDSIRVDGTIEEYINDKRGSNLIFKYKLLILLEAMDEVASVARKVTLDILRNKNLLNPMMEKLVEEIILYHYAKVHNILTNSPQVYLYEFKTTYRDFVSESVEAAEDKDTPYHQDDVKIGFSDNYDKDDDLNRGLGRRNEINESINLSDSDGKTNYLLSESEQIIFFHDDEQKQSLDSFVNRYGSGGIPALTRVLSKVYFGKVFRKSGLFENSIREEKNPVELGLPWQ